MSYRYRCEDCYNICEEHALLAAPNPFDATETVHGCPVCKSIGTLVPVCDVEGCERPVSCGWPSPKGYRHTCGEHYEK
jgi:MinD superfamily P-loop ATPase